MDKKNNIEKKVKKIIDEIRPVIQADGGDVEFIGIKDGVVKLKLKGACATCPMSEYTLKLGIEQKLIEEIPEVKKVKQV